MDKKRLNDQLNFGLLKELEFLECICKYFDNNSFIKTSTYFPLDFEILNDKKENVGWIELKSRVYKNDINLYISTSKLEHVHQFNFENVFLIWNDVNKNLYYVVKLTKRNLYNIKRTKTILLYNQQTSDINKKYAKCFNNIEEVAEYIKLFIK